MVHLSSSHPNPLKLMVREFYGLREADARQARRSQRKAIARDRAASVSATRRRIGRISLIAPAVCRADHYHRGRRVEAGATVELASSNTAAFAQDWAVERAMLAIEVHRHPAVAAILNGRGIDGGLDLISADPLTGRTRRIGDPSSELQANVACRL
jgi:hypothetical protein